MMKNKTEKIKEFIKKILEEHEKCLHKGVIEKSGYPVSANASQIIQNFIELKEIIKTEGNKLI